LSSRPFLFPTTTQHTLSINVEANGGRICKLPHPIPCQLLHPFFLSLSLNNPKVQSQWGPMGGVDGGVAGDRPLTFLRPSGPITTKPQEQREREGISCVFIGEGEKEAYDSLLGARDSFSHFKFEFNVFSPLSFFLSFLPSSSSINGWMGEERERRCKKQVDDL
jgi:hypothetical protein